MTGRAQRPFESRDTGSWKGDEETVVRAVLRDLVDTGLLFRSGRGDRTTYRATTDQDSQSEEDAGERLAQLV